MPAPTTATDLHTARTNLGLTTHDLAAHIDSTTSAIRGWEAGTVPIPSEVAAAVHRLTAYTDGVIASLIDQARQDQRLRLDDVPIATDGVFRHPLPDAWRSAVFQRVASHLAT